MIREVHLGESIQAALDASRDGDEVVIESGTYEQSLRVLKPINVRSANTFALARLAPPAGVAPVIDVRAAHVILAGFLIEGGLSPRHGVFVQSYDPGATFRLFNTVVRNTVADGVRLRRLASAVIQDCTISHALRWSEADGRLDAHGIFSDCLDLVVLDTVIMNCSGDSIQQSPNRVTVAATATTPEHTWSRLRIARCSFSQRPLETSMAGFPAGALVGENALDTKVPYGFESARPLVEVIDSNASGFRYDSALKGSIVNAAAWNIKEPCDATFANVATVDCGIAFRLRGAGSLTEPNAPRMARVVGSGLTIERCGVGFRCEDGIEVAHFTNVTSRDVGTLYLQAPANRPTGFTIDGVPPDPQPPDPQPETRTFRGQLSDDAGVTFDVVLTATARP